MLALSKNLVVFLIALVLADCSSVVEHRIESGNRIDGTRWRALTNGKTSEDEAAALLGKPKEASGLTDLSDSGHDSRGRFRGWPS